MVIEIMPHSQLVSRIFILLDGQSVCGYSFTATVYINKTMFGFLGMQRRHCNFHSRPHQKSLRWELL